MTAIIPEDFHERIRARCTINESGCLVYPTKAADGYARVTVKSTSTKSGYTTVRPSRVMYEAHVGPIPAGMELDHVKARGCTSTACCNPDHLEPVTGLENKIRANNPIVIQRFYETCGKGHEYTEENTYIRPSGKRGCRTCNREAQSAYRRKAGSVGLQNAEKTHCPSGHEYNEENTYISPSGARGCKPCRREHDRNRRKSTGSLVGAA